MDTIGSSSSYTSKGIYLHSEVRVVRSLRSRADREAIAPDHSRSLYLKTNLPAWALLWINIGVEIDLGRFWSASLPIYYSGWNYFRSDLKFRTLAFVPEVRRWLRGGHTGLFLNAHLGLGWYNYSKGGSVRWQDHSMRTPAAGGGLGIGWRFDLRRDGRWQMEAGAGLGAYRLDYDIIDNATGCTLGRRKRAFFGVDQAFLSLCYSIPLGKKGGNR